MPEFKEIYKKRIIERSALIKTPISRRSVLRGLSTASLALTLPVWRNLEAQTSIEAPPKRFISFFYSNGTVKANFFPRAGAPVTSSEILSPLQAFDDLVTVCKGVHLDSSGGSDLQGQAKPGGPHATAAAAMLSGGWLQQGNFTGAGCPCGYGNRITLDQTLASDDRFRGGRPFPSLEFGLNMRGQEPLKYMSYRGPGKPNPAEDNPWRMHKRLFANFTTEGQSSPRSSVLDYLKSELGTLKARLPKEDMLFLDAHMNHVRELELQLSSLADKVCSIPNIGGEQRYSDELFPEFAKIQLDLMYQAHACDLVNVSTFMWSNANSWQVFPWLGIREQHHDLSHIESEQDVTKLTQINKWYNEQLAYFCERLNAVREGERTMLENSLILCGAGIGEGNHTLKDIPWVLIGSAGGRLNTGSLREYNSPHNNLLLTILHAFGFTEFSTYGAPEHCTGVLPGLLKEA